MRKRLLLAILLSLTCPLLLAAQAYTGKLEGTILDSEGAVVPGALIEAAGSRGERLTTTTDENGKFAFFGLPDGQYEVTVKTFVTGRPLKYFAEVMGTSNKPVMLNVVAKPCSDITAQPTLELTDTDRGEIVRQILGEFLAGKVKGDAIPVLSLNNIKKEWLTAEQSRSLISLDSPALLALSKEQPKGLFYYSFSEFKAKGSCVEIYFNSNSTFPKSLESTPLGGGGTIYEFRKIDGKWLGLKFYSWVS